MAANQSAGMFADVLKQIGISNLSTPPKLSDQGYEMVLTEAEVHEGMTHNLQSNVKQYVTVKCEQGRIVIRVKL